MIWLNLIEIRHCYELNKTAMYGYIYVCVCVPFERVLIGSKCSNFNQWICISEQVLTPNVYTLSVWGLLQENGKEGMRKERWNKIFSLLYDDLYNIRCLV